MLRKFVSVAAIGAAAFAAIPATGAFADGPNTPPSVSRHINAQSWPVLQKGDQSDAVKAVQHLLRGYKLAPADKAKPNYEIPTDGNFDSVTEQAVTSFQGWRDLPQTGKVDAATWKSFRSDISAKPIKRGYGNAEFVKGAQVLLNAWSAKTGSPVLTVDGQFGAATYKATVKFQKLEGLDADGIVGPLTFKALLANF